MRADVSAESSECVRQTLHGRCDRLCSLSAVSLHPAHSRSVCLCISAIHVFCAAHIEQPAVPPTDPAFVSLSCANSHPRQYSRCSPFSQLSESPASTRCISSAGEHAARTTWPSEWHSERGEHSRPAHERSLCASCLGNQILVQHQVQVARALQTAQRTGPFP